MSWQILILLSLVLASVTTILQKILLRQEKNDPVAFSIFFQIIIGVIFGIAVVFLGQNPLLNINKHIFNVILAIILYGFGNVFVFNALKNIEASIFTVIFSSRALFTTLASTLILGEGLISKQFVGASFVISGIALATLKSLRYKFQKSDLMGVAAGLFFGLANTNDRFLLQSINLYPYLLIVFLLPGIFIMAIYPKTLGKMKVFLEKKLFAKILILCFIYSASAITFFAALQKSTNSSQVANINLTGVIVTVILSIIFLKERQNIFRKLAGAILSFTGLLLIG